MQLKLVLKSFTDLPVFLISRVFQAFTTISLFNLLQLPFTFLPLGLAQLSQSLVSTNRMLQFFLSEELVPYVQKSLTDAEGV